MADLDSASWLSGQSAERRVPTRQLPIRLTSVRCEADILPVYRSAPIGELLRYHALGQPHRRYTQAQLLVGMCMDHRKMLRIPDNFAYVLRAAGTNLRPAEFMVSFAIAVGGVSTIALIGHDQCGMTRLTARRDQFVAGLVERGGWERNNAEAHFDRHASQFGIPNGPCFIWDEALRLQRLYPGVLVAPLYYRLRDGALYQITTRAAD